MFQALSELSDFAVPLPSRLTPVHLINCGMIATGNHVYINSLRGAPPPGEGSGFAAKTTFSISSKETPTGVSFFGYSTEIRAAYSLQGCLLDLGKTPGILLGGRGHLAQDDHRVGGTVDGEDFIFNVRVRADIERIRS